MQEFFKAPTGELVKGEGTGRKWLTNHEVPRRESDGHWCSPTKKQELLASKALEKQKRSGWGRAKLEEKEEAMRKEVEVGTLLMLPCRKSGLKPLIFMVRGKGLSQNRKDKTLKHLDLEL